MRTLLLLAAAPALILLAAGGLWLIEAAHRGDLPVLHLRESAPFGDER